VTGGSPTFANGFGLSGTLTDTGATLTAGGTVTGPGTIDVAAHGVVQINGSLGAGPTVAFLDATGTLALANPAAFAGTIAGLVAGDTLDLLGIPSASITSLNYAAQQLTVDIAGGTGFSLHLPGSFTTGSFHVAPDGHNGAAITV